MKKFILCLLAVLATCCVLRAQEYKNYFEFTISEPLIYPATHWIWDGWMTTSDFEMLKNVDQWKQANGWRLSNSPVYEKSFYIPAMSLSYYRAVNDWLQVGGEVYDYNYHRTLSHYDSGHEETNDKFAYHNINELSFLAAVRFCYFHKGITDLYSGASLGVGLDIVSTEEGVSCPNVHPVFQVTALGVRFGNQVYGIVETGLGYKGFLNVGVGTRF